MGQLIEGKIAAHDRYHFELKLSYALNPELAKNKYNVELFFFIPKSLGINRNTYSKRYFFNDIQGYIRFKTPIFSFEALTDPSNKLSPLSKIKHFLETSPDKKRLIAELKLYACTVRIALRNAITQLRRQVKKGEMTGLSENIRETCNGLKNCLIELRSLKIKLEQPTIHDDVRTAYRHVDEFLGIALDGLLNSLHNTVVDLIENASLKQELNDILMPVIIEEYNYRLKHNYAVYTPHGENELFLYRKGILKKIITSILFLNTHTLETVTLAQDIAFAIAAGIAMIIATAVTIWAGLKWGSTSMPFVLTIVVGYMAKDRIKDWLKLIFSKKMTRWFSDYKTNIYDPATGSKIGLCRQAFSFLYDKGVVPEIMTLRLKNAPSDFWLPEDIIKYEKDIILTPRKILKAHARRRDITDIIRFNIHHFLERMDEPFENRRSLDSDAGKITEFKCARVYHINLLLKLDEEVRRIRLVLNQNGIVRLEEVR